MNTHACVCCSCADDNGLEMLRLLAISYASDGTLRTTFVTDLQRALLDLLLSPESTWKQVAGALRKRLPAGAQLTGKAAQAERDAVVLRFCAAAKMASAQPSARAAARTSQDGNPYVSRAQTVLQNILHPKTSTLDLFHGCAHCSQARQRRAHAHLSGMCRWAGARQLTDRIWRARVLRRCDIPGTREKALIAAWLFAHAFACAVFVPIKTGTKFFGFYVQGRQAVWDAMFHAATSLKTAVVPIAALSEVPKLKMGGDGVTVRALQEGVAMVQREGQRTSVLFVSGAQPGGLLWAGVPAQLK